LTPQRSQPLLEFTGERIVPGLVDADLFNEHLARYRFAARFAAGAKVLDAGCGTGYGAAVFENAERVTGVDISAEAVRHAGITYARAGVEFLQASCESLPFADGSFSLVTAFEVIEHLERWEDMLAEARRVLRSGGVLLVSTPNKAWYAEARGAAGPNPWHVREFEYREFKAALENFFPHVNLWTQNHSSALAFAPAGPSSGEFDSPGDTAPEQAHFFVAACSQSPLAEARAFAWTPVSGNILRERGRHIALLEEEVAQKNAWLKQLHDDHSNLQAKHEGMLAELQRNNEWAAELDAALKTSGATIAQLQSELQATNTAYENRIRELEAELQSTHAGYATRLQTLESELAAVHAGYQAQIRQLEVEAGARLDWVRGLEAQIEGGRRQIARLEQENLERTKWAQSLDVELSQREARLKSIESSIWVRIGRKLHLAPDGKQE
jgi:SAM-dependent methyltransferase